MSARHEAPPRIDVSPEQWLIIDDILRKHVPHSPVWAFGSRATGAAKPYSDLDLAIITARSLDVWLSGALSEAFSESDLPWKVDVVDWATTSDRFRQIIERDKVVLRDETPDHDHAGNGRSARR